MLEPAGRRPLLRDCLDWTERRPHLAGVLGAAICRQALAAGWIERIGTGRAVRVTAGGTAAWARLTGAEPVGPGVVPAGPGGVRRR